MPFGKHGAQPCESTYSAVGTAVITLTHYMHCVDFIRLPELHHQPGR